MTTEEKTIQNKFAEPQYLGDGVYARFDGHQIWVETLGSETPQSIALEPQVMAELFDYNKKLIAWLSQIAAEGQQPEVVAN